MTDWTQTHPTQTMTTPGGERVEIDLEMIPLLTQLWRHGFETLLACQDLGEAILGGGTRVPPQERESHAADRMGRAWLKVRMEDGPRLLEVLQPLSDYQGWVLHAEEARGRPWVSVTFPRQDIVEAAALLGRAPSMQ
ncbi:hypothetical protein [Spirillospora sp. NBC_01491]|uniref:hypothetical protein n=1 Tax=Spirillospora sp. NBC_01491 TaxID=2976007 RepID=UPI002E37E902|nr:hypothetical protein [Spirillospora sp. NBC_01491]